MFNIARPIFLQDLDRTPDVQAGFVLVCDVTVGERVLLRCTAATFYRAYVNGEMVAHGPARAAHGHARVDEIDVTEYVSPGLNDVAIEVAGYNLKCHYVTDDASFVQAEVIADGRVLAATGPSTHALRLTQRRPAERFSHARCAGEVYELDAVYTSWRRGDFGGLPYYAVAVVPGPRCLLPRGLPLPDLHAHAAEALLGAHTLQRDTAIVVPPIAPLEHGEYLAYALSLPERPAMECCQERPHGRGPLVVNVLDGVSVTAADGPAAVDFDFGRMRSGFIAIEVDADSAGTVDVVFTDRLGENGQIDARAGDVNGVVRLHLPAGRSRFVAFEPHALRYARVIGRGLSAFTLRELAVLDYAYPDRMSGTFACSDGDLVRIYDAARLTLRLNTLDVFTDCPGRERAGWLCDSLFSARAMSTLFGDASVERAMLENFLHAPESADAPGYFPECYPGKPVRGGDFIPNWSMFLGIELAEYVRRTADVKLRDDYRQRIERLVVGVEKSANAAGLLERLPGFTFLDWSAANADDYKHPVSTATNGLYALMLDALAGLYERVDWRRRADQLRQLLRGRLPAGVAKADALRPEVGGWTPGLRASEAAQYYLFWTGIADAEGEDAPQWQELLSAYGPAPQRPIAGPPLAPANVFIGLYLRLELLARHGHRKQLLHEMRALFLPMLARGPGTLWEHDRPEGSLCHGFAAYAAVWLVRDVLGIGAPDAIARTIDFTPDPAGLAWARGTMLVDGHVVAAEWTCTADRFSFIATVPPGYTGLVRLPSSMQTWRGQSAPVRFAGTTYLELTHYD